MKRPRHADAVREFTREKWQGAACEVIWFDEECPPDIYSEGLTRTNETGGIVFITFTPLDGVTEVVRRFLHEKNPDRHVTQATIDDAPHFSVADKKRIIASYLPHEAEARIKGLASRLRRHCLVMIEDRLKI